MSAINVKKRDGESVNSLIYRFTKRVQQSGVLKEARARRFNKRIANRRGRRESALHRERRQAFIRQQRKLGIF
ncbi:MAG: 30S ribosomal protein S21 [Candidatus Colwellbacteria bacterium]|nr:30S ribosomal protein S21 [Candidatus Colwellbacteria bacterium]